MRKTGYIWSFLCDNVLLIFFNPTTRIVYIYLTNFTSIKWKHESLPFWGPKKCILEKSCHWFSFFHFTTFIVTFKKQVLFFTSKVPHFKIFSPEVAPKSSFWQKWKIAKLTPLWDPKNQNKENHKVPNPICKNAFCYIPTRCYVT